MLKASTIEIVKATAPVLRQRAFDIASHFYRVLFTEHPELRGIFNQSHQQEGSQARALADSVIGYAEHIDKLEALGGAVVRITQKHVSLGVQPEHYPAVGSVLLRAIGEVLGIDATSDVIAAWGEAYQFLADILIRTEESIYQEKEHYSGGWRGTRRFTVARKEPETDEITSFYLQPTDSGALMPFYPGQYLTLRLVLDSGEVRRNYSLSDAPGHDYYRVSIKRELGGVVSNHLHDQVHVGSELEVFAPSGHFVLKDSPRPLVLVSAGVGITPLLSMLNATVQSGRQIFFLHSARRARKHAFRPWVETLAAHYPNLRHSFIYSMPAPGDKPTHVGRIGKQLLAHYLPKDGDVDLYTVGRKGFMREVYLGARALGVPKEQIYYEFFGPSQDIESAQETSAVPAHRVAAIHAPQPAL